MNHLFTSITGLRVKGRYRFTLKSRSPLCVVGTSPLVAVRSAEVESF